MRLVSAGAVPCGQAGGAELGHGDARGSMDPTDGVAASRRTSRLSADRRALLYELFAEASENASHHADRRSRGGDAVHEHTHHSTIHPAQVGVLVRAKTGKDVCA